MQPLTVGVEEGHDVDGHDLCEESLGVFEIIVPDLGFTSLFVSYWPPSMTMEAVLATILVAGERAQIQLNIEVSRNKLISTLIYGIYKIASIAASEQTCSRPPTPRAAWVHQIYAAGGASSSTTMVMVFGR